MIILLCNKGHLGFKDISNRIVRQFISAFEKLGNFALEDFKVRLSKYCSIYLNGFAEWGRDEKDDLFTALLILFL